jgi:hypothetical protein
MSGPQRYRLISQRKEQKHPEEGKRLPDLRTRFSRGLGPGFAAKKFPGSKQVYCLSPADNSGTRTSKRPERGGGRLTEEQPMKLSITERDVQRMKQQLQQVRRASLAASQRGDFRIVGKLTCEAAQLNRSIQEAEGLLLAAA